MTAVNEVINDINLEPLNAANHLNGSSSYHPQSLLKVLVYGYVSNIYSSWKQLVKRALTLLGLPNGN